MKTDFRAIVAAAQRRRGLTDYAVAKAANCSAEAYRKYLNGERECRSDVLERICAALQISLHSDA